MATIFNLNHILNLLQCFKFWCHYLYNWLLGFPNTIGFKCFPIDVQKSPTLIEGVFCATLKISPQIRNVLPPPNGDNVIATRVFIRIQAHMREFYFSKEGLIIRLEECLTIECKYVKVFVLVKFGFTSNVTIL